MKPSAAAKRYRALRQKQVCVRCMDPEAPLRPKRDGTPGVRCEACHQIVLGHNRAWRKKKRARISKAGRCLVCLNAIAMPGITRCGKCQEEHSERLWLLRICRRMDGLCSQCGAELEITDGRECLECCAMHRRKSAVRRATLAKRRARGTVRRAA